MTEVVGADKAMYFSPSNYRLLIINIYDIATYSNLFSFGPWRSHNVPSRFNLSLKMANVIGNMTEMVRKHKHH